MNRVALLVLAYRLAGPGFAVGLILLAQLLPRVIVSPLGGVLADRFPKRSLMIALDLLRAGLALSLVLADNLNALAVAGVIVLLMHSLSAIFNPARGAALPALVPREGLPLANALNDLSAQSAFFVGPALGGWIAAAWNIQAVFIANAITFLLSALFIALMRLEEPARRGTARLTFIEPLREGWRAMSGQPLLRFVLGGLFIEAVVAIGVTVLLLPLLTGPLGRPAEQLGLLLTGVGLGTILGAPLGLWLFGRYRTLPLAALVALGLVLSLIAIGVTPTFVAIAIALLINGVLTGVTDLVVVTIVQRTVPSELLGRAFGLMFWILALGQLVGALGGSFFLRFVGPREAFIALGSLCALITGVLLLSSLAAWRVQPGAVMPNE
jgi:MFS family permease